MVDVTLNRLGINFSDGTTTDLKFLRNFAGMVLAAYDHAITTKGKYRVRKIKSGKTASFPVLGYGSANYYTPGENILDNANGYLSSVDHDEIHIAIDNKLLAAETIDDIDEMKLHFDIRSGIAQKLGASIAEQRDLNLYRTIRVGAGRAAARLYANQPAGTTTTVATWDTDISAAIDACYTMSAQFTTNKVPSQNRYMAVTPTTYNRLINAAGTQGVLLDKDFSAGNGDYAKAQVLYCAGFRVVQTTNLPQANDTLYTDNQDSNAGYSNTYGGYDNTALRALFWHHDAIAEVQLRDMRSAITWHEENQCYLVNKSCSVGAGDIRQEACGAIIDP